MKINGEMRYLWRAVDGEVLESGADLAQHTGPLVPGHLTGLRSSATHG